eukprot:2266974-Pleurochrysis_carterae.AAC.1
MQQRRSLTLSLPSRLMRVHARQLPSSQLTMPQHSRRLNSTNSSPPCLLTACAPRKPRATAGTFCASDWPPGCSAQAVHPTLFKSCAGGSRLNPSPSSAGSKRSDAHFHQLACAASALASRATPVASAPTPMARAVFSCPLPNADANGTAALPAPSTQPRVFAFPRLRDARLDRSRSVSTKRSVLVAFPFATDEHGWRCAPVRLPNAHAEELGPSPLAGGTRETNHAATANPADDPARPTQPTLDNTPGVDNCSTPAPAAAMHANPTPRTTRVTRTAYGNGARP